MLRTIGSCFFVWVLVGIRPALASQTPVSMDHPVPEGLVKVETALSGAIRLEVREAPLGTALDALAGKVGVPIRYTHAPKQPVTLTCHGDSLKPVLRCLLGTGADLFFQYNAVKGSAGLSGVTVLASTFKEETIKLPSPVSQSAVASASSQSPKEPLTIESAMIMIRSPAAEERASGLELLGRIEGIDQEVLRAAYQEGLQDQDGDVRAAALAGMATLDRGNSFGLLAEAMGDDDPSVRLAAVDGMELDNQSRPYLEKALSDPDESVRELAGLRLGIIR